MNILTAQGLEVFYDTSQVLFGMSLSINQGETLALLGRNGAGKSTTMKAIAGLLPLRAGRIDLHGRAIQGRAAHLIARAGMGFVPEDRQIFPEHTVEDNLIIAAKRGKDGEDFWNLRRVYDMLPLLEPLKNRMVWSDRRSRHRCAHRGPDTALLSATDALFVSLCLCRRCVHVGIGRQPEAPRKNLRASGRRAEQYVFVLGNT